MRSLVVLVVGAGAAAAVPNHVVLVGGNLTLDGRSVSLARYDPERRSWAAAYTSKLYADAADARAAGVIRAVAANGSREVFLGGRFDATSADAQALYCGVGRLVDRGPHRGAIAARRLQWPDRAHLFNNHRDHRQPVNPATVQCAV